MKRQSKLNALLVVSSLLFSTLLFEVGARVIGIRIHALNLLTYDPLLGVSLRPGKKGWQTLEGSEFFFRVNSAGMRGPEYTESKPLGTIRIALLGDSFTAGNGVNEDKTFGAVLERELAGCPALAGLRAEVLNFGVSGYGAPQELLMLRSRVWNFHPDLVLLAVFSDNDIGDGSPEFCCAGEKMRPYLVFIGGELKLDDSFRRNPLFRPSSVRAANLWRDLRSDSYALNIVWNAMHMYTAREVTRKAREEELRREAGEPSIANSIYLPAHGVLEDDVWLRWEGTVRMIRDETIAHGAGFWMTTITNDIQVHPDLSVRQAFLKRLGATDLDYPNRRIGEFASREKINLIDFTSQAAHYASEHHVFLHGFAGYSPGFGHWNEEGNRFGAEAILTALCTGLSK